MRKILTSTLFILFLLPVSFVYASNLKKDGGPQVIKLQRFRKALWKVHVTLKGKEGDFLFDTGGGVTLITEKFSQGIDCRYWGRNTGYNMFGHKGEGPHCDDVPLSAGGVELSPVSIGKIDLTQWFPDEQNLPDGMLSLDAFDGKAITIDQKSATLTIETDKSLKKRVRSMREFPLRVARECSGRCLGAFMGVKTPDGMTWLNLDTGAGGVSLISKEYAATFGLDPAKKEQQISFALDGGVKIGGPVLVTDMIMDGNLGQPFLANYLVTIDLKNSRIWFAPAT